MKIREYQLKDLERARELQKELSDLHIPSPILSWKYEIKNSNGEITEKGIGKANSFTRNALNLLSWQVGIADAPLASASFGDGLMSVKRTNGDIASLATSSTYATARATASPTLHLGTGTGAESVDDYVMTVLTIGSTTTSTTSIFNAVTRKLITTISRAYTNDSASAIDVTEAGVYLALRIGSSPYDHLMIRDKFTAINVGVGSSIFWTYVTEVLYPQ